MDHETMKRDLCSLMNLVTIVWLIENQPQA